MTPKISKYGTLFGFGEDIAPHATCWFVSDFYIPRLNPVFNLKKSMSNVFCFLRTGHHSIRSKEDGRFVILEKDIVVNLVALSF